MTQKKSHSEMTFADAPRPARFGCSFGRYVGGAARSREADGTNPPSPFRKRSGFVVSGFVSVVTRLPCVSAAPVTDFLAGLRLIGSERVLGALALALAEAMDAAPGYAKGKIARELREILAELAKAELSPANLSLLEGVEL
jgi:hypothetical protein